MKFTCLKYRLSVFLLIVSINTRAQLRKDSLPRLNIQISLNGYFTGDHSVNWIRLQNCIQLDIDTIYVPSDKQFYITSHVNTLIQKNKRYNKDKVWLRRMSDYYAREYDNFRSPDEFDNFKQGVIEGFRLSGSRCCFIKSADSNTNCLSNDQLNYLGCLQNGDWIWIDNVKVSTNDSVFVFDSKIQIKIKN